MIVAFKTTEINKLKEWNERIQEKIKGHEIGIIFRKVDYDYFNINESNEAGEMKFLVLLLVDYTLPNIVPRKFLTKRILKSLKVKAEVNDIEEVKVNEAVRLIVENNCGAKYYEPSGSS